MYCFFMFILFYNFKNDYMIDLLAAILLLLSLVYFSSVWDQSGSSDFTPPCASFQQRRKEPACTVVQRGEVWELLGMPSSSSSSSSPSSSLFVLPLLDCWRVQRFPAAPQRPWSPPPPHTRLLNTTTTMLIHFLLVGALLLGCSDSYFSEERSPEESKMQPPTVVVAIIARNGAHSLPYYLGALERLNYPKDRISLW